MLSNVIEDALNDQFRYELQSAYLYLSMSAYCETKAEFGFAHWLRIQAREELAHALKFFDFIHDRGGRVVLHTIDQPQAEFGSLVQMFRAVVEHEHQVTTRIHRLYEQAMQQKDYASIPFVEGFITEQVEEEKNASDTLAQLERIGENRAALMELDERLQRRVE